IGTIPTGRSMFNLAVLVPGVSQTAAQDVGGARGPGTQDLVAHGSHPDGQRFTVNGISLGTLVGTANRALAIPNTSSFQEVTIDSSGASAELGQGGVRVNFIPRDGGNTFKGSSFITFANEAMQ